MTPTHDSACWSLQENVATFASRNFNASINLLEPSGGIANIKYCGTAIEGFVLGLSPSEHSIKGNEEIADAYVRGADLVVTYAQTDHRPFALQIYWRINLVEQGLEQGVVQLDAIVSLQTCLLESFPLLAAQTQVSSELSDGLQSGILLRSHESTWSYAEHVPPEDCGDAPSQSSRDESQVAVHHKLGGQFLEKGVIRRLRLRGLFLPRENDTELAEKHLTSLKTEELPLTA